MSNLVTWSPAVDPGGADDDAYNVPGAVNLRGVQDTAGPTRVDAGEYDYADGDAPTLEEVEDATGWNQVIGLVNYRVAAYEASTGTDLGRLSYLTSEARVAAADVSAITSKIGTVRTAEGWVESYSFPTVTAGGRIQGVHLAHCRQALALSGRLSVKIVGLMDDGKLYRRKDNPYNTFVNEVFSSWIVPSYDPTYEDLGAYVGKVAGNAANYMRRYRQLGTVPIPVWASPISAATVQMSCLDASMSLWGDVYLLEPYTVGIYTSLTDDTDPDLADAYNTATLHAAIPHTEISTSGVARPVYGAVDVATVEGVAGGNLSFIFATVEEVANAGGGRVNEFKCAGVHLDSAWLHLDF